jgi:hypothetical protein
VKGKLACSASEHTDGIGTQDEVGQKFGTIALIVIRTGAPASQTRQKSGTQIILHGG